MLFVSPFLSAPVFVFKPSEPRPLFSHKAVCSGKVTRAVFAPREEMLESCEERSQWLNHSQLYFFNQNMVPTESFCVILGRFLTVCNKCMMMMHSFGYKTRKWVKDLGGGGILFRPRDEGSRGQSWELMGRRSRRSTGQISWCKLNWVNPLLRT